MKTSLTAYAVLFPLAGVLFFFLLMARVDSSRELRFIEVLDVAVGLMFAVSYIVSPLRKTKHPRAIIIFAIVFWLLVSGFLVFTHELQVHARKSAAEYGITRGNVAETYKAIAKFAQDCGSFPTKAQGLEVLRHNPDLAQWNGPYVSYDEILLDYWNHRLQYAIRNNKPVVWSCGKDGQSGTSDDIALEDSEIDWILDGCPPPTSIN